MMSGPSDKIHHNRKISIRVLSVQLNFVIQLTKFTTTERCVYQSKQSKLYPTNYYIGAHCNEVRV